MSWETLVGVTGIVGTVIALISLLNPSCHL